MKLGIRHAHAATRFLTDREARFLRNRLSAGPQAGRAPDDLAWTNSNEYVTLPCLMLRVEEYVRKDGTVPFKAWFERLDPHAAAKVTTAVTRLSLGNTSNVKWFSGIGEIKVDWGPGYRVYLAKDGETLVLLFCGGTKKRQQADITTALSLHDEYKARKKAAQRAGPPRARGTR